MLSKVVKRYRMILARQSAIVIKKSAILQKTVLNFQKTSIGSKNLCANDWWWWRDYKDALDHWFNLNSSK